MFGDGNFAPGGYGHAPVPKKDILRHLCTRGVTVLLGETKTSKMCPCGSQNSRTSKFNHQILELALSQTLSVLGVTKHAQKDRPLRNQDVLYLRNLKTETNWQH